MDAKLVYQRVLAVARQFIDNTSHIINVANLKELNPTVGQLAVDLRDLANVLKDIAGDNYEDQDMALNAFQCSLTMRQIADCVEEENEHDLNNLVETLEMHAHAP